MWRVILWHSHWRIFYRQGWRFEVNSPTVQSTVLQTLHTGSQRSVISFWWIDAVEEHFYVCWLEMKYSQCMQSEWRNILTISRYLSVNTNNSQTIHNTIKLHSKHYLTFSLARSQTSWLRLLDTLHTPRLELVQLFVSTKICLMYIYGLCIEIVSLKGLLQTLLQIKSLIHFISWDDCGENWQEMWIPPKVQWRHSHLASLL